jgi:hypothetical protein
MKEKMVYSAKRLGWITIKLLRSVVLELVRKRVILRTNLSSREIKIGLFPYGTSDCIVLYQLLAEYLKSNGFHSTDVILNRNQQSKSNYIPLSNESLCYEDRLKELTKICGNSASILRGIVDEYRKSLNTESFFLNEKISQDFWEQTQDKIAQAKEYAKKYDVLFITEIAYSFCRALHFYALDLGKKVFVINPHGELLDVSCPERKIYHSITYEEVTRLIDRCDEKEKKRLYELSESFFKLRLNGKTPNDVDAVLSFNKPDSELKRERKKVLYLHCFRDDSQCLDSNHLKDVINQDLFLWTDKSFQEISREPAKWYIKTHPNHIQYHNESEILAFLLKKHNLNEENIIDTPSTIQVLSDKFPAYTLSGTIALESAAAGYKGFTMSKHYSKEITRQIGILDLGNDLRCELIDEKERKKAEIFLMLKNQSNRPFFGMFTNTSVRPTTNELERIKNELVALLSIFSLVFSKYRISEIRNVMDRLVTQISSEDNSNWNLMMWSQKNLVCESKLST